MSYMSLAFSDDILQSFDTHHPLVLPDGGYQFMVGRAVTDSGLVEHLNKLKDFIFNLPNLQSHGVTAASRHQVTATHFMTAVNY